MSELKPCPWCGGEASAEGRINYGNSSRKKSERNQFWGDGTPVDTAYFCNCKRCGCSNKGIIGHRTRELAITAWNTRHQSPALALAVDGLERISRNANNEEIAKVLVGIATDTLARIKEVGEATDEK